MNLLPFEREELVAAAVAPKARAKGWVRVDCPLCPHERGDEDRRQSLGLNFSTGGYNCFRCGSTGWVMPSLLDREDWEDDPVTRAPVAPPDPVEVVPGLVELYSELGLAMQPLDPIRSYLTGRGIEPEILREVGASAAPAGKLAGYAIIPIRDPYDDLAPWRGWFARDTTGTKKLKHRYARNMIRHGLLWNGSAIFAKTDEPVMVCEGILDALPYWPNAVATLGKPLHTHLDEFRAANRPVVVCLDGDSHGEGWAYAHKLRFLGVRASHVRLPAAQDPNSVERDWLIERVREAAEKIDL